MSSSKLLQNVDESLLIRIITKCINVCPNDAKWEKKIKDMFCSKIFKMSNNFCHIIHQCESDDKETIITYSKTIAVMLDIMPLCEGAKKRVEFSKILFDFIFFENNLSGCLVY